MLYIEANWMDEWMFGRLITLCNLLKRGKKKKNKKEKKISLLIIIKWLEKCLLLIFLYARKKNK